MQGVGDGPGAGAPVEVYRFDGVNLSRIVDFEAYPTDNISHGVNVTTGRF